MESIIEKRGVRIIGTPIFMRQRQIKRIFFLERMDSREGMPGQ